MIIPPKSQLIKILQNSLTQKQKFKWNQETEPTFKTEDIEHIQAAGKDKEKRYRLKILFFGDRTLTVTTAMLNIQENEQLLKWVKTNMTKRTMKKLKNQQTTPLPKILKHCSSCQIQLETNAMLCQKCGTPLQEGSL